ncbi:MAG: ParB/RepB/Spo0J family partition protein [Syntrophobacteria bacterium]|jgi:ParB family chromosome partitioning protein|nr:ParB/RepB/Spo0J family partition protein [Deltaproteobacteria bacterium]PNV87192.1 MAG: chromosome partitioning protein ParB [Desulfobacteraceae bacterium]MDH3773772.1 ParB/RepB/Spo0J family partition protein [Deltaproteobacteria bacterium]MDH3896976.1 ParB/RepB/Spo0J family partition protein [Deltaproteobacteria bacterium]MDH3928008.1 ParB/RepB/Spo0J family partition protein [Deltaproteobacteria bacterium]
MERSSKKKGLGKGLGALIPDADFLVRTGDQFFYCGIEEITPNPNQPRQNVRDKAFKELVDSVRERGILQPLLVRSTEGGYQLIAGERRWRAAQLAGLQRVPVIIKESDEPESFELALIENIQRKDLNPIEEGEAYRRLHQEFQLSQEKIAKKIGKDRSTVANLIRLLKLPDKIRNDIVDGVLSMGHARALLALPAADAQLRARNTIVKRSLTVRDTEKLIQALLKKKKKVKAAKPLDSHERAIIDRLIRHFGTKVNIARRGKRGKIEIEFYSDEDLQRILDLFLKSS